jgi:hypothetical protein
VTSEIEVTGRLRALFFGAIGLSVAVAFGVMHSTGFLHAPPQSDTAVVLSIKDAAGKPIANATVKFDSADSLFHTDNLGTARIIAMPSSHLKGTVHAPGYQDVTIDLAVPVENRLVNLVLTQEQAPTHTHDPDHSTLLEPYVEEVRSGLRPSGIGRNFSGWYELQSPPPKPGFEIDKLGIQYSLSGDRQCNSWSECQLVQISPNQVKLLFKLQGHDEWPSPQPAFSEAVLRVRYVPTPHNEAGNEK